MQMSPWGHKKKPIPRISGTEYLQKSFKLRSFAMDWNFLSRDKTLELEFSYEEAAGHSLEFDPVKTDPYVFRNRQHYLQILSQIKTMAADMEKVLTESKIPKSGFSRTELDEMLSGEDPTSSAEASARCSCVLSYDLSLRF